MPCCSRLRASRLPPDTVFDVYRFLPVTASVPTKTLNSHADPRCRMNPFTTSSDQKIGTGLAGWTENRQRHSQECL